LELKILNRILKIYNQKLINDFKESVLNQISIFGLTHSFYNYPARFSPLFARSAILLFTKPDEVVFDPFMGGGTSIIEAIYLKRKAVGIDINKLAYFITKVKTTHLNNNDLLEIEKWIVS